MYKKHAFSLIEALICFSLSAILLTSLLFWYKRLWETQTSLEKIYHSLAEEANFYERMNHIFLKAEPPFFTDNNEPIFCFDRGICKEPLLSNKVLGKLYLDSMTQTLCLGIWPNPEKEPVKESPSQFIPLLDHVDSLDFTFYCPPPMKAQQNSFFANSSDTQELTGWQRIWNAPKQIPTMIAITMLRKDSKKEFIFDRNPPILYPVTP